MSISDMILFWIMFLIYFVVVFFFYITSKTPRGRIITSILLGLAIAVLAYFFVPKSGYDLIRHQEIAKTFEGVGSLSDFNNKAVWYYEYVPQLYMMLIAKIGDYNLLQTVAALIGYSSLFYILIDCKSRIVISNTKFIFIVILVIFSQHIIHVFSGVFNYVAINLFALAVYLDYYKKRKILPWVLYLLTLFIHKSMFFPFAVLCVFKIKKGKLTRKFWALYLTMLLFTNLLLEIAIRLFNVKYLLQTKQAFDYYASNNSGDTMIAWYGGMYLAMSVIEIIIVLLAYYATRKSETKTLGMKLSLMFCASMITLSIFVPSLVRFASLVVFMSIPSIMIAVNERGARAKRLSFYIALSSIIFLVYSVLILVPRLGIQ